MLDFVRLRPVDGLRHSRTVNPGHRSLRLIQTSAAISVFVALAFVMLSTREHSKLNSGSSHSLSPRIEALASHSRPRFADLPIAFEMNRGQASSDASFVARADGKTVFLKSSGTEFRVIGRNISSKNSATQSSALNVRMHSADPGSALSGEEEMPGRVNYLHGRSRHDWITGIPTYKRVRQKNVYQGIDLVYYGNGGHLEYDFIVAPQADARKIEFDFSESRLRIDECGDLVATLADQDIRFQKPVAYQFDSMHHGHRIEIAAQYEFVKNNRVTVELGPYDRSRELVIDPTVSYSSYLGGLSNDYATSIALGSDGSVYIAGYTDSTNFPVVAGAFQASCGGACANSTVDAFVSKLDPTGSFLVYSTYLGGSANDYGNGIAIDASGDAYVVGQTFSSDLPVTAGAFQTTCGGGSCASGDAFVAELDPTGSQLLYSTYLGGTGVNQGNAIALDASNNAYVTGNTLALDFPVTTGAYQTTCNCSLRADAFVAELDPAGSSLLYSTYLGGSDSDVAYAIALDSSNNAYVTGYTHSTDFPTSAGAFQTTLGANSAAFVTSLNATGSALNYSTYLGGSTTNTTPCETCATSITVDQNGNAYVAGLTAESNFPVTAGAFQPTFMSSSKGHDAFITELNSTGTATVFSTYVGGSGDDGATSIAVDSSGNIWFKGNTKSTNFPITAGAYQTISAGLFDGYVAELDPTGSKLLYSSYLGGSGTEYGGATRALAVDNQTPPNVYVAGYTDSTNFPVTSGSLQAQSGGGNDAYVAKFSPSPNVGLSAGLNFGNENDGTTSAPQTITLTNTGNTDLTVSSVQITGTNSSDFAQTNNCTTIPSQGTCSITATFTPTLAGTETANISVTDNAPGSPHLGSLTGVGVGSEPEATLSASSLTFALQVVGTSSPTQVVTLTNDGGSSLSITSITISGDFSQVNTCGTTVAAGANCTITVTFTPTHINTRTGTITVTDNASGGAQTIALTGVGTYVMLSPASLGFGTVTVGQSSSPQTITLTNKAKSGMTIKSVTLTGTNASDFSETNKCGKSIAAGKNCTITVTFKPTATGSRTANVSISDLGGGSPQLVPLTGTGD